MSNTLYILTGAPEAYDYETATTVAEAEMPRGSIRIVEVTTERNDVDYLANYQADRYRSGLYAADVYPLRSQAEARLAEIV